MAQKIYAFGGGADEESMKSAEVYDVVQNSWKKLPDLPEKGQDISCVAVKNLILMSTLNFRLMSYDIDKQTYSYVGAQINKKQYRSIAFSKEKLYLFESDKIWEMTQQY